MILRAQGHSDAFMRKDLPTLPFGNTGEAESINSQYYQPFEASNRAILKFTLPPSGKPIVKISVMVYVFSASTSAQPINCHSVDTTDFMEMGVTWNTRYPANNWTTAGGNIVIGTPNASITDSAMAGALGWQKFIVYGTGSLSNISLPAYGSTIAFVIKSLNGAEPTPPAGATCSCSMSSSQSQNPDLRPYLAIEVADDPYMPPRLGTQTIRPRPFAPCLAR